MEIIKYGRDNESTLCQMFLDLVNTRDNTDDINLEKTISDFNRDQTGKTVFYIGDEDNAYGYISLKGNYLDEIMVSPNNQSQGLGKELLNFAEDYLKKTGHLTIELDPFDRAIKFYESNGYKKIDETNKYSSSDKMFKLL